MKKYKTIYADPPWMFDDKLDDTRKKPYNTMSITELCELPIKYIIEEKAHLYLWVPDVFYEVSFDVIQSWSFRFITPITWRKLTKTGKIWFGMGHYFRHATETCFFCTKNNLRLKTRNTRNIFDAIKPEYHSGKPEEMYNIIENNSYPPYLELFARSKRKNWDSIGYEIDNTDIGIKLNQMR